MNFKIINSGIEGNRENRIITDRDDFYDLFCSYGEDIVVAISTDEVEDMMNPDNYEILAYRDAIEDASRMSSDLNPREFEVPVIRGDLGKYNGEYLPDINIRDVRQHLVFDLDRMSPNHLEESKVIYARIREGITEGGERIVRTFRFYQVRAPKGQPTTNEVHREREREYFNQLFEVQSKLRDLYKNR